MFTALVAAVFTICPRPPEITFPGGSVSDFVATVSRFAKEPVVFLTSRTAGGDPEPVNAFKFSASTRANLRVELGNQLGLGQNRKNYFAFSFGRWSPEVLDQNTGFAFFYHGKRKTLERANSVFLLPTKQRPNFVPPKRLMVKNGFVRLTGRPVVTFRPVQLLELKFAKKLSISPFLLMLNVVASCPKTRDYLFLKILARAIGAQFTETPTEYKLKLDPSVFRKRAVSTCVYMSEHLSASSSVHAQTQISHLFSWNLGAEVYKNLPDLQVTKIFDAKGMNDSIEYASHFPGANETIVEFLNSYGRACLRSDGGRIGPQTNQYRDALSQLDVTHPIIQIDNFALPLLGFIDHGTQMEVFGEFN